MNFFSDFCDLLAPRYCPICGARLGPTEQKLCTSCLFRLPYINTTDYLDNPTARLLWAKIPIERACSFINYRPDSDSHRLIVAFKYGHRPDLATWLGSLMARQLEPRGFFSDIDVIVPIPLHWRRQWSRGYNQSMKLAQGIAQVTALPILRNLVSRRHHNETQTHKTAAERTENVQGIFHSKSGVQNLHILLVDDVLTTGATLTSCAQSIMQENPGVRFSVLTLAKA